MKELSLKAAQENMALWNTCQEALYLRFSKSKALIEAADSFKNVFFKTMQFGFVNKQTELKQKVVKLLNHTLTGEDESTVWPELQTAVDDYMRLGTAEVFTADQQADISLLGQAALVFRKLAFHCLVLSIVRGLSLFSFSMNCYVCWGLWSPALDHEP